MSEFSNFRSFPTSFVAYWKCSSLKIISSLSEGSMENVRVLSGRLLKTDILWGVPGGAKKLILCKDLAKSCKNSVYLKKKMFRSCKKCKIMQSSCSELINTHLRFRARAFKQCTNCEIPVRFAFFLNQVALLDQIWPNRNRLTWINGATYKTFLPSQMMKNWMVINLTF